MLTLSQVMAQLAKRDITKEYRMDEQGNMKFDGGEKNYKPEDLRIRKSYRFEGDSNPDDSSVLYVAEDKDGNKGLILDAYGAPSNYDGAAFDTFVRDIPIEESDEYSFD